MIDLAQRASGDGVRIELGGMVIANAQGGEISSEVVGLAIAALVLLLTFGSMVAAGLPFATALFGLGISSGVTGLLAALIDVPDWAPALASMLGIGVGIDYALLIVTRYRAALAAGRRPARRGRRGDRDRGPLGPDRRDDRGDLAARPVPDGPPLPLRRRARRDRRRRDRDGGLGHARAGADGDGRPTDRPAAHPGHEPDARRPRAGARRALGPRRPAPPVDRRDRRRGDPARARRPGHRAAPRLPGPRQRRDRHHDPPGLRPRDPGLRAGRERPAARRGADVRRGRDDAAGGRRPRHPRRRGGERAGRERRRARLDAHGRAGDVAAGPRHRGPRRPAARPGRAARRRRRPGRRRDRRARRPERGDREPAAAVHRRRGRPVVPAPARRVPLDRRLDQGGGDEPALDRRRLRDGRVPGRGGLGGAAGGDRHPDAGAAVHPGDHVRGALRPEHGLRGVPALARAGGVPRPRRHRPRGHRGRCRAPRA